MSFFEKGLSALKYATGLGKKHAQAPFPAPRFEGHSATPAEPNQSSDATTPDTIIKMPKRVAVDGGYKEPGNEATFHDYDEHNRPTHITANVPRTDIRPRNSEAPTTAPITSKPAVESLGVDQSKVITTEATKVTVAEGTQVAPNAVVSEQSAPDVVKKTIDQYFVDSLFANPDLITTSKDLLERLGEIREFSFGQRQSKEDKTKVVELTGELLHTTLKNILDIVDGNNLSELMKLRGEMGVQIGQDKDMKSAAINTYLKKNGVTNTPPIRDIATRILTEKFSVPGT